MKTNKYSSIKLLTLLLPISFISITLTQNSQHNNQYIDFNSTTNNATNKAASGVNHFENKVVNFTQNAAQQVSTHKNAFIEKIKANPAKTAVLSAIGATVFVATFACIAFLYKKSKNSKGAASADSRSSTEQSNLPNEPTNGDGNVRYPEIMVNEELVEYRKNGQYDSCKNIFGKKGHENFSAPEENFLNQIVTGEPLNKNNALFKPNVGFDPEVLTDQNQELGNQDNFDKKMALQFKTSIEEQQKLLEQFNNKDSNNGKEDGLPEYNI